MYGLTRILVLETREKALFRLMSNALAGVTSNASSGFRL